MNDAPTFFLACTMDCEATQPAVQDPDLGRRAATGYAEILEREGLKGTFYSIPSELRTHASLYRDLEKRGHEVGLHLHPADQGYEEFLGVYGAEMQEKIIREAADIFAREMGRRPAAFCSGYGSGNDHTCPVLEKLGFRHGAVGIPTRVLPECCSVWAGMPLDVFYPHRYFRTLPGDVDFVQVSTTVDPDSRMWGGKHPQDLRVELVDAKNHWYTIRKAVQRQLRERPPVPYVSITTHNTFEYSDPKDFRRQTLEKTIAHAKKIFDDAGVTWQPGTVGDIAATYRTLCPPGKVAATRLGLDRRGHGEG